MSTLRRLLVFGFVCCLWGAGTIDTASAQGNSPRSCRRCHDTYFSWADSAHNISAYSGERFQDVWKRQRSAETCLTCHTTGYDPETGSMDYEGVSCAACHQPLPDDMAADDEDRDHPQKSIPSSAEACGTCHGSDHALTYTEWEASAHNGEILVTCIDCHDPHSGHLVEPDIYTLCGDCHFQPVPPASAHIGIEDGCTNCHTTPINDDNVHMHGGSESAASCVDCHMVTQDGPYGNFLADAGHTLQVPLAACTNCHGALHELQPGSSSTASPE